ncbi:MAG: hypothetical protein IPJ20_19135 [Flammeovirgaceae bacterium]|jgi:hypothetical protein|nr:hypothetical protein [Flammeovirgaceae bacterium]
MKPLKFLYTDGRDVVVTDYMLETKKSRYHLKGVTNFGLAVIKPRLLPGLTLISIGLALIADVYFNITPYNNLLNLSPTTEFFIGIGAALVGFIFMIIPRKRYALRIETAEGYKHVVISKSKEYIDQVLNALRRAKMTGIQVRK